MSPSVSQCPTKPNTAAASERKRFKVQLHYLKAGQKDDLELRHCIYN
jgi:hypothetical protein